MAIIEDRSMMGLSIILMMDGIIISLIVEMKSKQL